MNKHFLPIAVLLVISINGGDFAFGKAMTIANQYYTIRWNDALQQISVDARQATKCRIPRLSLVGKVTQLTSEPADIPHLGSSKCWRLQQEDGSVTSIILFDNLPLIGVQKSVSNRDSTTRSIDKLPVVDAELAFGKPAHELVARGTAGLHSLDKQYGSYVFGAVADPATQSGVVFGWASNLRGQGIVFPGQEGEMASMSARVDYGDLRLGAGGHEQGELLLIGVFQDVCDGLEQYAVATAKYLQIRLRPLPAVYCTWYHAGASDEQRLAQNTDFAAENLKPWGLSVMQIDDKWQPGLKDNGPKRIFDTHDPDGPFPNGMKATADHIRSQEMVPGIWFMPFSGTWLDPFFADKQDIFYRVGEGDPTWTEKEMANQNREPDRPIAELPYSTHWAGTAIDCSNPRSREYIRQMVRRMSHEWGYKYFKMDGFHTGSGSRQRYVDNEYQEDDLGKTARHDPSMTPIESYRLGMSIIRKTAGDDVFFLGCCQVQNLRCFGTTFGMLDAMRVGPDNGANWANAHRGPRYGSRYYFLNKRVWHCDPDPFYVRPSWTHSQATTLASWIALAGQLTASSYDYYKLPPDRLDIIRRVTPTHTVQASRPIDFLQRDVPHEWLLTDDSSGVRRTVLGHFNWGTKEAVSLSTPIQRMGLEPEGRYVGFDYWGNRFVPAMADAVTHNLSAGSCKIISVYPAKEHPQLVSTSRHVTQGIVDVIQEKWDAQGRMLIGKSRVVANDPYELRIAVPAGNKWNAETARVTGDEHAKVSVAREENGVRVRIDPSVTGEIVWKVRFSAVDGG